MYFDAGNVPCRRTRSLTEPLHREEFLGLLDDTEFFSV